MQYTNPRRLEAARVAAGLSDREVGAQARLTGGTVRRFADGEGGDGELSLRSAAKLAAAVCVPLSYLLGNDAESAAPSAEDAQVEALLAGADSLVRSTDIAFAMSWTLKRTLRALDKLDSRLLGSGQMLYRGANGYALRPRAGVVDDATVKTLARARLQRRGLKLGEARLLCAVIEGTDALADGRRSNSENVSRQSLLKAGVISLERGATRLAEDVSFSLMLET